MPSRAAANPAPSVDPAQSDADFAQQVLRAEEYRQAMTQMVVVRGLPDRGRGFCRCGPMSL